MTRIVHTPRLTLCPASSDKIGALHAHWTDADVRRFLYDGVILPIAEVATVIAASSAGFAASGIALWTVHRDGVLIGAAGLRPLDDLGTEIYYSFAPETWGNGYAIEVVRAVVDQAFTVFGLPEIFAEIDDGNTASAAVATRLNMKLYDTVPGVLGPLKRYVLRQ